MTLLPDARAGLKWRLLVVAAAMLLGVSSYAQFPTKLNITLVASNNPPQATSGFGDVWGEGNLACMGVWTAYSTFGIGIYDISTPSAPTLLTVYNYTNTVKNRFEQGVIRNRILYVGCWGASANGSGL